VFDSKGYVGALLDDIAAEARVSKGSIYNYFDSKEDLFGQVIKNVLDADDAEMNRLIRAPGAAGEKLERLVDYVLKRLEPLVPSGHLALELWFASATREELCKTMASMHAGWRARIQAILEEGVRSGEFNTHFDPPTAATLVWAIIIGVAIQSTFDRRRSEGKHSRNPLGRNPSVVVRAWSTIL
jgi:AcrR family transcriptional regulator